MRSSLFPFIVLLFLSLSLFLQSVCFGQDQQNQHENMDNNDNYVPSVESLTPYQSAMDFFQGKLKDDDTLAFTFVIISPAESYAIMIERTLKSKAEYGITVTISPKRKTGTMEIES